MISWSLVLSVFAVVLAGLGMPVVIFLLRENIKEIRQGIITDLAHFFESGKDNRALGKDELVESYRIIPSFEFVKYKYFLSRTRQGRGNPRSGQGRRDLAVWKFALSMAPFAVVVIAFSCLTLSYFLTQYLEDPLTPGDIIEKIFGSPHPASVSCTDNEAPSDCAPDWLRADDLAFLIIASFFGAYIASIRRFLRAVSNFDLGPLTFLRATDQMITGAVAITVLFIAFPSADLFTKLIPATTGSNIVDSSDNSWIGANFMPWIAVAFVVGMIPDIGLLNLYDRVKLNHFKRHSPDILKQVKIVPLEVLDGIDSSVRDRLEDLGIYDVQNLATANPIMLFVESPFGIYQTIDWVAQAQLCTAVGPESFVKLRRIQIRTIFDFEVAILGSRRTDHNQELRSKSGRSTPTLRQAVFSLLLSDPAVCTILRGSAQAFDDDTLVELGKVIMDDLHVHRLRQLCIIIQERLGARFGLPHDAAEAAEADTTTEETNVALLKAARG
jgi:hypothetical protein